MIGFLGGFLHMVLIKVDFPQYWVDLLMSCVSTVLFSIMINGWTSESPTSLSPNIGRENLVDIEGKIRVD